MKQTRRYKYALTGINAICYYTFGMSSVIFGQTLDDLRILTNSSFAEISFGFTINSLMNCVGSLLVGWSCHLVNRQKAYSIAWLLYGAALLLIPHLKNLTAYLTVQGFAGCLIGCINTIGNVLILELWQKDSNPFMQATHFCWTLGSTTAPLLVAPFLSPLSTDNVLNQTTTNDTNVTNTPNQSTIIVPFTISGCLLILAGLLFLTTELLSPYVAPERSIGRKTRNARQSIDLDAISHIKIPICDKDCSIGCKTRKSRQSIDLDVIPYIKTPICEKGCSFGDQLGLTTHILYIVLGSAIIAFFLNVEASEFNFLPSFLTRHNENISKRQAAYMYAVFSLFHTAVRGLSVFIAMKVKTYVMLYASFVTVLAANLLVLFYGGTNDSVLWIAIAMMGAGSASVYPSFYSFMEEHIDVTNAVGAVMMVFGQMFVMSGPIIMGNYMDSLPLVFIYSNTFCISLVIALFGVLHSVGHRFYQSKI